MTLHTTGEQIETPGKGFQFSGRLTQFEKSVFFDIGIDPVFQDYACQSRVLSHHHYTAVGRAVRCLRFKGLIDTRYNHKEKSTYLKVSDLGKKFLEEIFIFDRQLSGV
jgi:hypothetical protein